jgi:CO/xanthine dehydrogenase Mo-binding subunit
MTPEHGLTLELSQHEIDGVLHWFELNRRDFLKVFSGGLLVCLSLKRSVAQESGIPGGDHPLPQDIASWLYIGEEGHVTVYTGKVEMGQNIRTSLAQQVAEELRVPMDSISMIMGDTDQTPWDAGTFGSRTTPTMGRQLRTISMNAREMLVAMAARRWNVQPSALVAAEGRVTNPHTQQAVTYGQLTHGQKLVQIVGDPELTPATQWKIAGKSVAKLNARDFVTGKHEYASDMRRPGMLSGKVLRPAGFKATLVSLDTRDAENIAGVRVVRDGDFIGVVAPDAWTAERGLRALKAEWNVPPQPSNRELFEYLKKNVDVGEQGSQHVVGSVEQAMASADIRISQVYTVEYLAHAPLEPRAAVAEWNNGKLTVWTGTQRPFAVRDELVKAFRIPESEVRVLVPDTGSAYGGKHTGDAAIEAARLAKAAGKPVKLVWTREEEFTWAYFRPAGVIEARSGARRDGAILAWEFHNYNSGPAAMGTPYDIPNQAIQYHPVRSPLRQGSYRALAATANHFARETHMDELAHALGMDPLVFRLKNTAEPRLRAVFEAAAERFKWGRQKATPARGFGIAGGIEKGGHVATCAEVEIDPETRVVRIQRVVEAFECGAVVNPDGLQNQIAGAIIQGTGGALFEAVRFREGRILNPHFAGYRVPRFKDAPEIEVILLDRKDLPSAGAGETPIVGIAPAVGNAIFAATGVRLCALPLVPDALPVSNLPDGAGSAEYSIIRR